MSELIDEASKWLDDYGHGYQDFAGGPTHEYEGKDLIVHLRDDLEAAEAKLARVEALVREAKAEALESAAEVFSMGAINLKMFKNKDEWPYWQTRNEQRSHLVESLRARAAEIREKGNEDVRL